MRESGLPSFVRTSAGVLCMHLLIPTSVLTALCPLAPAGSSASLATHFVPFYFFGAVAAAALAMVWRQRWAVVLSLVIAAFHGALLLPYVPLPGQAHGGNPHDVRVMVCNVATYTWNKEGLVPEVRRHDPDLLLLMEVNDRWLQAAAPLEPDLPYRIVEPRGDGTGIALFSRLPVQDLELVRLAKVDAPAVKARCRVGETWVDFLGVHTIAPFTGDRILANRKQMEDIGRFVAAAEGPFVLAGDLNNTMWSPSYRDMVQETGLQDTRKGRGILGTWPAKRWPACVPIDHVLVDERWTVVDCRRGNYFRSDHFPLIVDLALRPEPQDLSKSGTASRE